MKVLKLCMAVAAWSVLAAWAGRGQAYELDDAQFVSAEVGMGYPQKFAKQKGGYCGDGLECGDWEDVSCEKWHSKFGGRIMWDYAMWAEQDPGSMARFGDIDNYTEFRRVRFFMQGCGYGVYDYKIQLDFEPEVGTIDDPAVSMKDLYVGINEIPYVGYLRFGHFKVAQSIEELTDSNHITFLERSLPNVFVPDREIGVQTYSNSADGSIGWSTGVFFDSVSETAKQRVDDRQGTRLASRVWASPYYCQDGRYAFHTGASVVYTDDQDNIVTFSSRPETHEGATYISTGPLLTDDYTVYQAEVAAVAGPLSMQAEFFYTTLDDVVFGDVDLYGAYAYASYFLTGESRNYHRHGGYFGRVKPHSNFWIVDGVHGLCAGPGAWELTARWSYLDLSDHPTISVLQGEETNTTLGVNWYMNPYVRVMFNWIHTWNDYDLAVGGFNEAESDILSMRMQVDF